MTERNLKIDYTIEVMNNDAESNLIRPSGTAFTHINARRKGRIVSGTGDHITGILITQLTTLVKLQNYSNHNCITELILVPVFV